MKIGYLGPEGTYSHSALLAYLKQYDLKAELLPFLSFPLLFEGYSLGKCDRFILPLENSIEGTVSINLDLLFSTKNAFVSAEILYPIVHCLMVSQNWVDQEHVIRNHVTEILSYSQPLAQCRDYLFKHFSHIPTCVTNSTGQAAELVKNSIGKACIGSSNLASLYGLKVIETDINDYPDNVTRFVMVGSEDANVTGVDKTSIVFSAKKDKPGSLVEILNLFADQQINLTKIESRPSKQMLGEYVFYIDCEGHRLEEPLKTVLENVEKSSSAYRCLGSYPKGQ